jgi:integrase/recombinase XerD
MSPMASPTHNAVVERFVRTFKNFKISDLELGIQEQNIQQVLQEKFINIPMNMILVRQIIQKYVDVYNQEIKTKKAKKGAKQNNRIFDEGKEFLKEPNFKQSYSSHAMKEDTRREDIQQYKLQLVDVWTEINQALPGNISFDQAKPILLAKLRTIEQKVDEQFQLSLTTDRKADELIDGQKLTMNAVGQVAVAIETLREEVRSLQNKSNSNKTQTSLKIQLRDPIYGNHYDLFMIGAGQSIQKKLKVVRTAQLRIIYTVLYFSGLRINEVKNLTKEDFILATQNAEFNIIHSKTKTCQKHVLPLVGKNAIQNLLPEIKLIFEQYGFQFLGNSKVFSKETFSTDNFIRFVNNDMSFTCRKFGVLENFKSHSFRVGYITKLLRILPVQKVAAIIGHKDTESTMAYQRYIINKEEIQNVLKDAFEIDQDKKT